MSGVRREIARPPVVYSGATVTSTYNLRPPTPKKPQPKIDATDRRQVEARNEDKAHSTKEALDDIAQTSTYFERNQCALSVVRRVGTA